MSIERAIINRSQPFILSSLIESTIKNEVVKGCLPNLAENPTKLEPNFLTSNKWMSKYDLCQNIEENENYRPLNLYKRYSCWLQPDHTLDWVRSERLLKHLAKAQDRISFEIIGSSDQIEFIFKTTENDADIINVAFQGEYKECLLVSDNQRENYKNKIMFYDFYPQPPYHHLFTTSYELSDSPFYSFIHALNDLPKTSKGFLQVLFEPVRNNWHQNVEKLNDMEYFAKSINTSGVNSRYSQQPPSGDIRNMARDIELKAHNDKPFYSVSIRSGIITEEEFDISGLTSFMNLFQHGGKQLNYITNKDYEKILSKNEIDNMFENNLTYRNGFLLNSKELTGIVHLPSMEEFKENKLPINFLDQHQLVIKESNISEGANIGISKFANKEIEIKIPTQVRKTCTHIIGRSGSGKSTLLENLILQDIEKEEGLAVIDPHGDTIKRILQLIPEEKVDKTIYIDFGDNDFIPIWNPIKRIHGQSIGRIANDLVASFKSIIKSNAWGDRLEHLLRNGFNGLLHLDDSTLYDLLILFEHSSKQSREKRILTERICNIVEDVVSKRFWDKDFGNYRRDDFTPPHHKLSKLLNSDESVSLMLSQPNSYLNFHEIISSNKILLFDLSNIGSETRKILGSYLLSTLHNYTIAKSSTEIHKRNPFNIYCDEAHKFTPDTLEEMMTDARKFGVNLTFAHQYLNQFNHSQRDALLSSGSTIIFNVDLMDARILVNNLQGKVEIKDIAQLETGEAIARMNTEIIKVTTQFPLPIPKKNYKDEIIKYSREKYYKPINEVKRIVNERLKKIGIETNSIPLTVEHNFSNTDGFAFDYDKFT